MIGKLLRLLGGYVFTWNITPRRFLNLCLVAFQHLISKNSSVIGYPIYLIIDPSSICSLRCPLCPTGQRRKERTKGMMSFSNFKRIIDELGSYVYNIDLFSWGEPLLNQEVYDMIQYAHRRRVKVKISSHLNLLDEDKAERLVKSGLDSLIVSLDGASQETYQRYMVGGDFNLAIKNLKILIQKKEYLKSPTPHIMWKFFVMKQNEHELTNARRIAIELGVDEFQPSAIHGDIGFEPFWTREKKIERCREWLPDDPKYGLSAMKPCDFLWLGAAINWNGSVSPCCLYYPEKYDFGNMFNEGGFKRIWNNKKYRAARRIVREGKSNSPDEAKLVCSYCIKNNT